jgi:hypothetical protein
MFLHHPVSLVAIAEVASKTANGEVAAAIRRIEFVDVSKLAGSDKRHAEAIDRRKRVT